MASKRRLRRKACLGKRRLETQGAAWKHLRKRAEREGLSAPVDVYHCQFCGGWHFGRTAKWRMEARAQAMGGL